MGLITGIAHVNLLVPQGTLDEARAFYGTTLGFDIVPVPALQKDRLAWYIIISTITFHLIFLLWTFVKPDLF